MRLGVRLGIDLGAVRIGLSRSDAAGILASPLTTILRSQKYECMREISAYVNDLKVVEIIFGLPKSMSGVEKNAAYDVRDYVTRLALFLPETPIRFFDERLSTVQAHRSLYDSGISSKKHRKVIDQVAAVVFLQNALDLEHNLGSPVGELYYSDSVASEKNR